MAGLWGGLDRKYWGKPQSVYDTVQSIAATDAFDPVDFKIEEELTFEKIRSHVGSLSVQGEIEGKRGGKWSGQFYVSPAATGVAPDIGFILAHAFGTETVSGGVSVTYSLNDAAPNALQFFEGKSDSVRMASGAWVEELVISVDGGKPPLFDVRGGFASYGCLLQGATVSGVHTGPDTTIQLGTGHAYRVRPGVYVKFGTNDNGGAGYLITAIDYTTDLATISPTLSGSISNGDAVAPVLPSQTLGGTPVGGIACGLSLGGTDVSADWMKASVKFATGIMPIDKTAGSNRATRIHRVAREFTAELEAYYAETVTPFVERGWNGNSGTLASILRIGADIAGARCKVNNGKVRLGVPKWEHQDDGAAMVSNSFLARQVSVGGDECTVVFD